MGPSIRHAIESIVFLFVGVPLLLIAGSVVLALIVKWLPEPKPNYPPPPRGNGIPATPAPPTDDSHIGAYLDAMIVNQQAKSAPVPTPRDPARSSYLRSMIQTFTPDDHDAMQELTQEWQERWYELRGKRDEALDPLFREIVDLHWELSKAIRANARLERLREQQAHYQQAAADRHRRASHHSSRNIMYGGSLGHALGTGQQAGKAREFENKAAELALKINSMGAPSLTAERCRVRLRQIAVLVA